MTGLQKTPTKQAGGTPNASGSRKGRLIKRQKLATRVTHWMWAACMFFLLLSGLQIFNAHPALYVGQESGFDYDNSILSIRSVTEDNGQIGVTTLFGMDINTTGFLGLSGTESNPKFVAFPEWATIPSNRDLATGRVVHFFFAWIFVAILAVWLIASLFNRHLKKDLLVGANDVKGLWADIVAHARFRFDHRPRYSPLQKIAYASVLFAAFPLIILTGLAMSPGMNAAWPWLIDILGGRQTARSIHFFTMIALVLFFVAHILMVMLAGPINELRSMVTGRYRLSASKGDGR